MALPLYDPYWVKKPSEELVSFVVNVTVETMDFQLFCLVGAGWNCLANVVILSR